MKLTIEIENDQIGHLTAEQISILKDHISRMIERYGDEDFLTRTRKRVCVPQNEPLIGKVDWVMNGVRLVETSMGNFSFELDI